MGAVRINVLGPVGSPIRWTPAAKYCYARGCICKNCKYDKVFESQNHCNMKGSVLELVCRYGAPFERRNSVKD